MAHARRHPRTVQTEDLSATLRAARRTCVVGRVLNLSEGGMLVAGRGLKVDETASLELARPDFRFAGVAKVAHRTDQAIGLQFLSWQGPAHRPICTLIAARVRAQLGSPDAGRRDPRVLRRVVRLQAARAAIEETVARIDAGDGALNTEGAIACYFATEAGNAAADAAIQALGGYRDEHDYMVKKIKRCVRITRISDGTSETVEVTISRGRWQEHMRTGGDYYHARARELEALHAEYSAVGADIGALAYHALAELLECCRVEKLTRHQHILLLRLGALIAQAEGAAALARRAQRASDGQLEPKAMQPLDAGALAAASRVNARGAALTIATEAGRWVAGGTGGELGGLEQRLDLASIHRAQGGLRNDLQTVADALVRGAGELDLDELRTKSS